MTGDADWAAAIATGLRQRLSLAVGLPEVDVDFIAVGEWGVALETLCTQIFKYDVELAPGERSRLEALRRERGVPVPRLLGDPWGGDRPS